MTKVIKRDPYRMVYSSSPDRGLDVLLRMWPDIKKEVPQSSLSIYYGFFIFDQIHKNNPARMRWKQQMMEMMKQEGITYYGKVGKEELYQAMKQSGIWSYYSTFTEISCQGAMESQICGCIPVVTNFAALQETVKNGIRIEGDPYDLTTQEEYKKALISLLKDHKRQEELREPMMKWAKDYFLWSRVAADWDALFRNQLNLNLPKTLEKLTKGKEERK